MGRQRPGRDARDRADSAAPAPEDRADKTCASCGRRIEWRATWARDWGSVRYCSDACRARGVREVDRELEASIRSLLDARAAYATICPSEAARAVAAARGLPGDEPWRELMEPARRAARRLVATGEMEITQGGRVVDPSTAKGPIRVRKVR
ncbi:DUF2256 and DUF3253 domain-containing protein [Microcella alkaliphila]|uniref:DUF2256 and DUF3253 domain-containing protein n=1 Tax=Microcella alkaliphila TaxID=279828 RepID=A0A0U4NR45_9MICO|nr:DUF2256 and DUF3253 domain-containing protein [Microcella alkaliphila]BAU30947.1 predicted protein [Microcella alkaliphila]